MDMFIRRGINTGYDLESGIEDIPLNQTREPLVGRLCLALGAHLCSLYSWPSGSIMMSFYLQTPHIYLYTETLLITYPLFTGEHRSWENWQGSHSVHSFQTCRSDSTTNDTSAVL